MLRAMASVLLLNGPNLNLLGQREPEVYGATTLSDIEAELTALGTEHGHEVQTFQSQAEHEIVNRIHEASRDGVAFIIINPAALTHTSVALRDALLGTAIPFIEVHISNVAKREEFRHHSYLSDIAVGTIAGLGAQGYRLAFLAALEQL